MLLSLTLQLSTDDKLKMKPCGLLESLRVDALVTTTTIRDITRPGRVDCCVNGVVPENTHPPPNKFFFGLNPPVPSRISNFHCHFLLKKFLFIGVGMDIFLNHRFSVILGRYPR